MARDYPAFLFYAEDFEAGTAEMSNAETGMYIRLLCHQWHKLFVPDDPARIAFITRAPKEEVAEAWPTVRAKFKDCGGGQLKNQRLEKIRAELKKSTKARSASGKAGAEARWGNGKKDGELNGKPDADGMANASQSDSKHMASRVGDVNATGFASASAIASGFKAFWEAVPNKTGKAAAEKAYAKAVRMLSFLDTGDHPGAGKPHVFLCERMKAFAASPIGRGDKQFIPHPSKWLNEGRYDDDPTTWNRRRDPRGTGGAIEDYLGDSDG